MQDRVNRFVPEVRDEFQVSIDEDLVPIAVGDVQRSPVDSVGKPSCHDGLIACSAAEQIHAECRGTMRQPEGRFHAFRE